MQQLMISNILLLLLLVPLAFFIYTIVNLETLQIPITHPRVEVEFCSFLALVIIGLYLRFSTSG